MCTMACADPAETPVASQPEPQSDDEDAAAATKPGKAAAAADAEAADPAAEAAMVARRVSAVGRMPVLATLPCLCESVLQQLMRRTKQVANSLQQRPL